VPGGSVSSLSCQRINMHFDLLAFAFLSASGGDRGRKKAEKVRSPRLLLPE
jgi:hypothetical protein